MSSTSTASSMNRVMQMLGVTIEYLFNVDSLESVL